jgi:hypothetical protein
MDERIAGLLPDLEAQLAEAEARVASLRQAVSGLRGLSNGPVTDIEPSTGETATNGDGDRGELRGREAVRAIVAEKPGATWKVGMIAAEMLKRGWVESPTRRLASKSAQNAISRMQDSGEAVRIRPGVYRFNVIEGRE